MKEENYSPYCELCDSCGDDGCCSAEQCCYTLMVKKAPKGCSYGGIYYNDMTFGKKLGEELYEYIMSLPDMHVDMKDVKEKVDQIYDELYDKVY